MRFDNLHFPRMKNNQVKKSIMKEIISQTGKIYNVSNNMRKFVSSGNTSFNPGESLNRYKLVYEISLIVSCA